MWSEGRSLDGSDDGGVVRRLALLTAMTRVCVSETESEGESREKIEGEVVFR